MIKCAIFDLDGTLVDSMNFWADVPNDFLKKSGIEEPKDLSREFLSMSLNESAKALKDKYGFSDSIDEIALKIDKIMEDHYRYDINLKNGVLELIEYLSNKGIKMAIATATDEYLVRISLKKNGIDKYFDYILTSNQVGSSKQKPDIYRRCAEHFGAKYSESMIFEDLPYGIISTKADGFTRVGIYDKPSEELQEIIKTNADFYFKDFGFEARKTIKDFIESRQE